MAMRAAARRCRWSSVVGVPIAFVGAGERLEDLEPFHADRFVSRLLGMGDVLSLIEKAEEVIDGADAAKLEEKIRKNTFSLGDFRDQLRTIRKMGPLEHIMKLLPGMGPVKDTRAPTSPTKGSSGASRRSSTR